MGQRRIENEYYERARRYLGSDLRGWEDVEMRLTLDELKTRGPMPGDADWEDYYDRLSSGFTKRREVFVPEYGFAVPTEEALDVVARFDPIVELGAGTGYWAHLLEERDVSIVAYDLDPPPSDYHKFAKQWTHVRPGNVDVVTLHHDRTLFLCWPPLSDPMAAWAIAFHRGEHVIYIGEGYGGCTGDDAFHKLIEDEEFFEEIECVDIPQWYGLHDRLYVYKRKQS